MQIILFLFAACCLMIPSCRSNSLRQDHPSTGVFEPFDAQIVNPTILPSSKGELEVWYIIPVGSQVPLNESFNLHVQVYEVRDEIIRFPLRNVSLSVDAGMPEHMHGMNVQPKITQMKDGSFLVEGMLFHMPGRWELYFDITRNGVTERAQTEINLE